MARRMSAADWGGWKALYAVEPWGCEVEDLRAGLIAAEIFKPYRDTRHHPEPLTARDFVPRRTLRPVEPAPAASPSTAESSGKPARVLRVIEAMSLAMKGRDNRKQRPRYEG